MECSAENYKSIYIDNTYAKNLTELYNVKVLIYLKTSDLQDIKKCINEGKDGFTDYSTKKRCANFLSFTNKYSESNLNDYLLTINNADANKNSIMLSLIYEKKNGELNTDKNYRSCLNNKILTSDKFNSYSTDKDKITADVTKAKQLADMVIVLPHWGTEYVYTPDSNQNYWTQLFLSLGVDVVIGTHPHVLEPVEVVSDTKGHEMLVYYSLGNFVSNQDQKPRMIGGMAKMTLVKDETGCYVKNYNLTPVITQKLFGKKAITTYKLSDYTESLASGNAIRNDSGCSDFSLSYCQTLVKQILGDDYDESTSELNVSLHPNGLVKDTSATESSSSAN